MPTGDKPPRSGRLGWTLLWALMIAWVIGLTVRAHGELAAEYTVEGLFRSYHSPYETALGAVVDPRPALALPAEIQRRYAPDAPAPGDAPPTDAAGWTALLDGLGLNARPFTADRWTGAPPRLRLGPDGPLLLIGLFGVDPVALVPGVGVVRIPEGALPPATVDLALVGAREPPW